MPGFNQCLLKCLPCSLLLDISKPAGPGRRKRSYRVGWVQVDERKKGNGLLGSGDTDTKVSEQGGQRPGVQVTCPGPSRAGAWGTAPAAQAGWALGRFPGESPAQREGVSLRAGRQGARLPPRTHAPARPRLCQGSRGQEGCPIWGATLNPLFSLHLPVTPASPLHRAVQPIPPGRWPDKRQTNTCLAGRSVGRSGSDCVILNKGPPVAEKAALR